MPLILNIDTAIESASACIAKDGIALHLSKNENQKDHAAWLHIAIKELCQLTKTELNDLDAVAITIGPGSYTGLRIGLAAAKGICYALNKPLITINTLLVMANATKKETADLFCPMIDARRMEVFTALFSRDLRIIMEPRAIVLDDKSFADELSKNRVCFFGNGSMKFKSISQSPNSVFSTVVSDASHMINFSEKYFLENQFANLAYTEPLYLKEFYTPAR